MNEAKVRYDAEADVLYVQLGEKKVAKTGSLGDLRLIDYDADAGIVGIEFISASEGVDLRDLPFAKRIEHAIGESGLEMKVLA
jgi:uncharacterized protein YuzE